MSSLSMTTFSECESGIEIKLNTDNEFLLDAAKQFGYVSKKENGVYILHVEDEVKKIVVNHLVCLIVQGGQNAKANT